jgi:hypothetical protein
MGLFVKRAFANVASGTTDGALVTAVAGSTIKVLGVAIAAGAVATSVTFNTKPSGAGSAISATFALAINGTLVLPETENGDGWFETAVGEGLTATTGIGGTTGIQIIYSIRTP